MTTPLSRGLPVLLMAVALFLPTNADTAESTGSSQPLTVVELFTSQGCSSCPPADAYLGELAQRPDVLALSEHVDYWDYIGWKDIFASPDITARQRAYAKQFAQRYVYTPQMVVQGAGHATGSDREAVEELIEKAAQLPRHPVEVTPRSDGGFTVTIPDASTGETQPAIVWLAVLSKQQETSIRRGENAGRSITYYNVVRELQRLATWKGKGLSIPVDEAVMAEEGYDACAVLLQSATTGRILGAARFGF